MQYKYLILLPLFFVSQQQNCDPKTQIFYEGACISKQCMDTLSSVILETDIDPQVELPVGTLSNKIQPSATIVDENGFTEYLVSISYSDTIQKQLVGSPQNCIDYRIYQTTNEYNIDKTRANVIEDGAIPKWPKPIYTFDQNIANIQFNIKFADFQTYKCLKFESPEQVKWQCFFELAFVLRRVTQVSYYFCIQIINDMRINTAVSNTVDFQKIVQQKKCDDTVGPCTIEISVKSSLQFCSDQTCNNQSDKPFEPLYINKEFYMMHKIINKEFPDWYILNPLLTFQGPLMRYDSIEGELFEFVAKFGGYNIYKVKVPFAANEVLITFSGSLSEFDTQRFLQQQITVEEKVIHANSYTGGVTEKQIFFIKKGTIPVNNSVIKNIGFIFLMMTLFL